MTDEIKNRMWEEERRLEARQFTYDFGVDLARLFNVLERKISVEPTNERFCALRDLERALEWVSKDMGNWKEGSNGS